MFVMEYCKGLVFFIPSAWFSSLSDGPGQVCHPCFVSLGSGFTFLTWALWSEVLLHGTLGINPQSWVRNALLHLPEPQFHGLIPSGFLPAPLCQVALLTFLAFSPLHPPSFQTFFTRLALVSWCPLLSLLLLLFLWQPSLSKILVSLNIFLALYITTFYEFILSTPLCAHFFSSSTISILKTLIFL